MGWGKELELHRQKKLGLLTDGKSGRKSTESKSGDEVKQKPSTNHTSSIALIAVVGVAAAGHALWKRRSKLLARFFPSKSGGSGSTFRFPSAKSQNKAPTKGSAANGSATGKPKSAVARDDNLPRNKAANNKKNKNRKKEKREQKQLQQAMKEAEAKESERIAAEKAAKNQIPKDEDIVGGELGKTFTTTSHIKVSKQYAKIRETVGKE